MGPQLTGTGVHNRCADRKAVAAQGTGCLSCVLGHSEFLHEALAVACDQAVRAGAAVKVTRPRV